MEWRARRLERRGRRRRRRRDGGHRRGFDRCVGGGAALAGAGRGDQQQTDDGGPPSVHHFATHVERREVYGPSASIEAYSIAKFVEEPPRHFFGLTGRARTPPQPR